MQTRLLPTALLFLLGACASDWKVVGTREETGLKDGALLVTLERGRGTSRERRLRIRDGGEDVAVGSVDELLTHMRPIETPEVAIAYSDLVRQLGIPGSGARGNAVVPDPTLTGSGGNGRYSRKDAEGWGVSFEPTARLYGGGFEVSRIVLLRPVQHPMLPGVATAWRLVQIREVVFADGVIRPLEDKTLTNGQDAARFADL
jgi:hypothetical protein